MPFVSRRADLLERSLQGLRSTDPEVHNLVATVGRIPALTSRACGPRDEFVSELGLRLRAEALTQPAREVRGASSATVARRSAGRPLVFVIGRGLPRVLAGATASLLVVGAGVGGVSRSALPGGVLYPVRQLLDSAAVQLAGSDLDRGTTLLSQAQEHISDAVELVQRGGTQADPAPVDQALLGAYEAVTAGQRALLGEFDRSGNPQALIAVQDFMTRALPQLYALRPMVPADSKPDVDALITLLQDSQTSLASRVGVCGQPCASIGGAAPASPSGAAHPAGRPSPLVTGGIPIPGSTATIIGPGGVVAGPSVPSLLTTTSGTAAATLPAATLGSITVSPSPVLIPPLPLPTTTPTPTATLPSVGLPGLP